MGDDTPLAVLSGHYRGLHHFFRQQFSQVTNPPIDPLREWRVMSLKTRFGNLGNVYDEDPSQTRILQLESPVLTSTEVEAVKAHFGDEPAHDRLHLRRRPRGPPARRRWSASARRPRRPCAAAARPLILSDEAVGPERAPIPMILAVGAVHSHLVRQGLRSFSSLIVRIGRVPRRALLRRADRRRRHRGQRLPGRGRDRRPPRPRPVPGPDARGVPRPLQGGDQPGPAQGDVQDGHLDHRAPIAAATISRPWAVALAGAASTSPG